MRRLRHRLLLTLLLSSPALAGTFSVSVPAGVDLARNEPAALAGAQLVVRDRVLFAPHGVRLEAVSEYTQAVPIVLERAYVVRDGAGALFRVWIHGIQGARLRLEVTRTDEAPRVDHDRLRGHYAVTGYHVGEAAAAPSLPPLRLFADGTYRFGSATGRWEEGLGTIALDGYYAAWGKAELAEDGRGMTFTFTRAALTFVVELRRQGD